jgi:hypothetical protein
LIDRFRHALDLERNRFDRLRLAAFGSGEALIDVGQRAFDAFFPRAFKHGVQFRRDFFAHILRHRIEALLEHGAHGFGFLRRAALFDTRAERGDRFSSVRIAVLAVDSVSSSLSAKRCSALVQRLYRAIDFFDLRAAGAVVLDARHARFERGERAVRGLDVGFAFERGEALGDVLLRLAQIGEINRRLIGRRHPQPA